MPIWTGLPSTRPNSGPPLSPWQLSLSRPSAQTPVGPSTEQLSSPTTDRSTSRSRLVVSRPPPSSGVWSPQPVTVTGAPSASRASCAAVASAIGVTSVVPDRRSRAAS